MPINLTLDHTQYLALHNDRQTNNIWVRHVCGGLFYLVLADLIDVTLLVADWTLFIISFAKIKFWT